MYQTYVQFVDQVKTKKLTEVPAGTESYESVICTIENDFAELHEVKFSTTRFDQFCGTKQLSEITEGRNTDVTDPNKDISCKTWSMDYETSSIDNDSDGREMVTCSFYRDSVATNSDINFLRENTIHFISGFNVFEDNFSEYRIASGTSKKIEMKMFEETGAYWFMSTMSWAALLSAAFLAGFWLDDGTLSWYW